MNKVEDISAIDSSTRKNLAEGDLLIDSKPGVSADTPDLSNNETADIRDDEIYSWNQYSSYALNTADSADDYDRNMADILTMNKMTRYFRKILTIDRKPVDEDFELMNLKTIKNHQKMFNEKKFTWELAFPDMGTLEYFVKLGISKLRSQMDIDLLDHDLFQKMFPIQIIDNYLSVVNREFGKPVYDKTLIFQTCLLEIFLWHHLDADTKYCPKIKAMNINTMDPFLRIRIREENSKNSKLMAKYFNSGFDLKKFTFKLLDLYFPNVSWRYIGGDQEMNRWTLHLLLKIFEMGWFDQSELIELVNLLLSKLENLLVLEKQSYIDMTTTLVGYPTFVENLKNYFFECKETVAMICLHIVIVVNDSTFMRCHYLYNSSLKPLSFDTETLWLGAYFSKLRISNVLNRILTTYLLLFTGDSPQMSQRFNMYIYINDFLMLTLEKNNDVFCMSSNIISQSMIEFYHTKTTEVDNSLADKLKDIATEIIEIIAFKNINKKQKETDATVKQLVQQILDGIHSKPEGMQREHFCYLLGIKNLPKLTLIIFTQVIELDFTKATESKISELLLVLCERNTINQLFIYGKETSAYWKRIFSLRPVDALVLDTKIFSQCYNLFFVHRGMFKRLTDALEDSICNTWTLKADSIDTVEKWFNNLKNDTLVNRDTSRLTKLMVFYSTCKILSEVIKNRDLNYDQKFMSLTIQEVLVKSFFGVFMNVILDKDFLPKDSADIEGKEPKYLFKPILQGYDSDGLLSLIEKTKNDQINENQLRGIVFEIAMLTMQLLNRACSGLYLYTLYKHNAEPVLYDLLAKTDYLFGVPEAGLHYRATVLNFFAMFKVMPNDSLLTNRSEEFPSSTTSGETSLPDSHLTEEIVGLICDELNKIDKVEKAHALLPKDSRYVMEYYFMGLLPVVYKYAKGLYDNYTVDGNLSSMVSNIKRLKDTLTDIGKQVYLKFGIKLSKEDKVTDINDLMLKFNQIMPKSSDSLTSSRNRLRDNEEKLYTELTVIRDSLTFIIDTLDDAYRNDSSAMSTEAYNFMKLNYIRVSPMYSTRLNLEPWVKQFELQSDRVTVSSLTQAEKVKALNLVDIIVKSSGLSSAELRHFVSMMDKYREMKCEYMEKPPKENILLKFMDSGAGSVKNLFVYMHKMVQHYFIDPANNNSTEDTETENEERRVEIIIKTYLQAEVIYSFFEFLSDVLSKSASLRNGLYELLMTEIEEAKKADSDDDSDKKIETMAEKQNRPDKLGQHYRYMISIIYFVKGELLKISFCKPFQDREQEIIEARTEQLCKFFKNMSENNCQKFKIFIGTFKPRLSALPSFNSNENNMLFDLYIRTESILNQTKVTINKTKVLEVNEKPENFKIIINLLRVLSEACNGPCYANQKQIYMYRADYYTNILTRSISNIDSSLYMLKDKTIDFIDALMEGNSPDIVQYFARNITFDTLLKVIIDSVKRLYIYCKIGDDQKKYREILLKARLKKKQSVEKQKSKSLNDASMEFYANLPESIDEKFEVAKPLLKQLTSLINDGDETPQEAEDEIMDTRNITDEIMDYFEITDYEEIRDLYMKNNGFNKHLLLEIALKLNSFLLKFANLVGSYKINLDNVYVELIDLYNTEVPMHIFKKMKNYYRRPRTVYKENIVIYMFLISVTSEIELISPINDQGVLCTYPLLPETFFLTPQTKLRFVREADTNAMTVDLLQHFPRFYIEMKDNLSLYRSAPLLYKLTSDEAFYRYKILIWILGMLLNLVFIIVYKRDYAESSISHGGTNALLVLAIILICFSSLSLISWFISRYIEKVKIARQVITEREVDSIHQSKLSRFFAEYITDSILREHYPVFFLMHLVSNILGLLVAPVFYTFQVLTIVFLSNTASYVVKAITSHADQLSLTFILAILVMYCYSVLTAEYFWSTLESNQPGNQALNCTHMWECLMYVVNYGLRNGGGIGDSTQAIDPMNETSEYVAKFFFDIVFFVFINVISLNIIFGIIIDTFADMRQKNDDRGISFLI